MCRRRNFGRRCGDLRVKILPHRIDDRLFGSIGKEKIGVREQISFIWHGLRDEGVFVEPLQELAVDSGYLLYRCSLGNAESEWLEPKSSLRNPICHRKGTDRLFE